MTQPVNFRRGGALLPQYARVPLVAGSRDPHAEGAAALLAARNEIARQAADLRDENADLYRKAEILEDQLAAADLEKAHVLGVVGAYVKALDARIEATSLDRFERLAEARHNLRKLLEPEGVDDALG